jgi:hypothetical protein
MFEEYDKDKKAVVAEDIEATAETANAICVTIGDEKVWFPKGQIHEDSEVFNSGKNSTGRLIVSRWIAEQKGLVD